MSVRRVAAIDLFVMPQRWPSCRARITSFFALLIGTLRRNPSAARIIERASFPVSVPIVASSVLSVLFILSSYSRVNALSTQRIDAANSRRWRAPSMHVYEVRPRKDHRGFDLISDVLPFGRFWYAGSDAVNDAIGKWAIGASLNY